MWKNIAEFLASHAKVHFGHGIRVAVWQELLFVSNRSGIERRNRYKTVECLSRNLMIFDDGDTLHETYISAVQKEFDESTVLIVDDSETIAKNCSVKLEGLCKVHDGTRKSIL